ncbi:MAG TPA: hypothetical protein DCM62_04800 [Bacteroidales bacterium]|nr:hypothetical protein [Bacteroidales bacterium]
MNKYVFYDNLSIQVLSLLAGRNKYFSKSLDAHSFEEHLEYLDFVVPDLIFKGDFEISVAHLSGVADPAIKVVQWLGYDFPTIIYHHDFNEQPFNLTEDALNSFYHILLKWPRRIPANLLLLRAPFHNQRLRQYYKKVVELDNFMAMLSVQAMVTDKVVRQFRSRSKKAVLVVGIGLGGWITNLHRAYFNTAQAYIPILAGTRMDEMFLTSGFKVLVSKESLKESAMVRNRLNFFTKFRRVTNFNLYPLLARFDNIARFDLQKSAYNGFPLRVIDEGHISAILKPSLSRDHILEVLERHS